MYSTSWSKQSPSPTRLPGLSALCDSMGVTLPAFTYAHGMHAPATVVAALVGYRTFLSGD